MFVIVFKLKLNKSKHRQNAPRMKDAEAVEQCILKTKG